MGKWLYIFIFISSLSCLLIWDYTDNLQMSLPADTETPGLPATDYSQAHFSTSNPNAITCTLTQEVNLQFHQYRSTSSKWKTNTHFFYTYLIDNSRFILKEYLERINFCQSNLYSKGYIYFTQKLIL